MSSDRVYSEIELINGSVGDPVLYVDYPDRDNALLFDAGDNSKLAQEKLADLEAVFITHHHVDHFIGLDRIVRMNIDSDKTLSIFGPCGTIQKVYDRIKSYEYQYFPFMKIVVRVHEILDDRIRWAILECSRQFPEPEVREDPWGGGAVFGNDEVEVEAVHVDHTVPCIAYALLEKPGYQLNAGKLQSGLLRLGDWTAHVLSRLKAGAPADETVEIQGGQFRLGTLAQQYFRKSRGARVAYVTDTAWNESVKPGLLKLANRAQRLYCDSFYSEAQAKQAERHRHMTATRAAQFAMEARVDELVLIHFAGRYAGHYEQLVDEASAIFPKVSADVPPPK